MTKGLFLRLLLIDSLFAIGLVAARLGYHRHIHPAGMIAIAVVLALFTVGAVVCAKLAWREPAPGDTSRGNWQRHLDDVGELAERLPAVAMLGTVSGFLIALSASAGNLQQRATGASTALAATFIGIACWLVLGLQHRMLERHDT